MRAARAAQFSRLTNQVFIIGAVISDPAVDANKHSYHICYITVRMLTADTRFEFKCCSYQRVFLKEKYKIG